MKKVVVITGPTAVGKTKLSIAVAKYFNTMIINADAYQIYKKMNIGTAKITLNEMENIHHYLIDYLEPSCEFSICDYQTKVREIINQFPNDKIPLLVGGSGLYIDSVVKDYYFEDQKRKDDSKYDSFSNEELYEMLNNLDADVAKKIHPNNRKRVIRALELANHPENKTMRNQNHQYVYDTLCIFLSDERDALYQRIDQRVDDMINQGLIEEVKSIKNYSKTSSQAIGYKEIIAYLNNQISLDDAVELIKKNSRHYAKRQFTWFKNKTSSVIVNVNLSDFSQTINQVINLIEDFIKE